MRGVLVPHAVYFGNSDCTEVIFQLVAMEASRIMNNRVIQRLDPRRQLELGFVEF